MISAHILAGMDFFAPEKKVSFKNADEALHYLVNTQLAPTPLARARYCEDSLKTAVQTGTRQYVILGAGLDSFAFRNPEFLEHCRVFEVDAPATQQDKIGRIRRAGWRMPENLRMVAADFARDDLAGRLRSSGFDPGKKTFFSWLGVSYYLSQDAIAALLSAVRSLSTEGSTLLLDSGDEGLFSAREGRVQNMLAMACAGGEKMQSCFSYAALERLLEEHGFLIYEYLRPEDIQERYFDGRDDGLSAFEHICYTLAAAK